MQKNRKLQLAIGIAMFLVSVFMAISYGWKISNQEADGLTKVAFYVWLFSILVWMMKVFHDVKALRSASPPPERP